jgi:hypothetical protein
MTPDRIQEILEGCEGVTPGPWYRESTENEDEEGKFTSFSLCADDGTIADTLNSDIATLKEEQDITEDGVFYDLVDIVGVQNIDHLSRLDPDTVRQLCLLALKGLEAEKMEAALHAINALLGNLPDEHWETGVSNDAKHRGSLLISAREIATAALPSPPIQEQS